MMSIDLEIKCTDHQQEDIGAWMQGDKIHCEPCTKCLEEAEEVGYNKGYKDGEKDAE